MRDTKRATLDDMFVRRADAPEATTDDARPAAPARVVAKEVVEPVFDMNDMPKRGMQSGPGLGSPKDKKSKKSLKVIAIIIAVIVIAGLAAAFIWQYTENQRLRDPAEVQKIAEVEDAELVASVAKLMELPDGEPVVATVSDIEKLKDQVFFERAANNDKVLIFSDSAYAIIYRPSENKIINSGPIAVTANEDGAGDSGGSGVVSE